MKAIINIILNLLEKIPYKTRFGLSLADLSKIYYHEKIGQFKRPQSCLCGGIVKTRGTYFDGWETTCLDCNFLYDED